MRVIHMAAGACLPICLAAASPAPLFEPEPLPRCDVGVNTGWLPVPGASGLMVNWCVGRTAGTNGTKFHGATLYNSGARQICGTFEMGFIDMRRQHKTYERKGCVPPRGRTDKSAYIAPLNFIGVPSPDYSRQRTVTYRFVPR